VQNLPRPGRPDYSPASTARAVRAAYPPCAIADPTITWPRALWGRLTRPLQRIWESEDPFDDYALVHMASAAGDALVAIALADSIFFSLPVGEAKLRVALYLGLTMAPLAVAGPLLVPLLDRGGFRRAISFAAAAGRAVAAVYAAPRIASLLLFPASFAILVMSRVHAITKNGLTAAYAPGDLVRSNARLGRMAVLGVGLALPPGFLLLALAGATSVLYLAAGVYLLSALFTLFLRQPPEPRTAARTVERRGRIAELATAAAGSVGLRAAHGFLLFLVAFALRRAGDTASWLGVLMVGGATGHLLGDFLAPYLPRGIREEAIVLIALGAAGGAALFAFATFSLFTLTAFTFLAGTATRLGQLAFASLMQRSAPGGAHGRVFVRYEVLFQMAWVAGAFLPALLPIAFRPGVLILAAFYVAVGFAFFVRPRLFPGGTVVT
jgi:hypothetical protein